MRLAAKSMTSPAIGWLLQGPHVNVNKQIRHPRQIIHHLDEYMQGEPREIIPRSRIVDAVPPDLAKHQDAYLPRLVYVAWVVAILATKLA